jgi:NAD(P)-dependent dehydrogenase (short-subunit alcohol dehydrogenase family)
MKVLVTGGSGFLGGAVCRLLAARGDEVVSLARGEAPALAGLGARHACGDITALESVLNASQGMDAVIHVAGKAGDWGTLEEYYAANVAGTDNVIAACFMNAIPRLVYTSTPSVVHEGGDIEGGDESLPYARQFSSHYPRTKALAEQRVLKANGPDLATVALRPHLIFGPAIASCSRASSRVAAPGACASSRPAASASTSPTSTTRRRRTSMPWIASRPAPPSPAARTSSRRGNRWCWSRSSTRCCRSRACRRSGASFPSAARACWRAHWETCGGRCGSLPSHR